MQPKKTFLWKELEGGAGKKDRNWSVDQLPAFLGFRKEKVSYLKPIAFLWCRFLCTVHIERKVLLVKLFFGESAQKEKVIMLKEYFVKQAIKEVELEKFIEDSFPEGDYSKIMLQRTPLGLKVVIYTNKPGRIIGKGGRNIDLITRSLKDKFGLENPQIDIKSVENPDLDAKIVAKQMASALERGFNYKKIGNVFLKRVMDAGAIGVQIIIAGKLGGAMSRTGKFIAGYIKHSGQGSIDYVDTGFYEAQPKLGKIGVTVRIMKVFEDITGELRGPEFFKTHKGRVEIAEIKKEEQEVEKIIKDEVKAEKLATEKAKKPARAAPKKPRKGKESTEKKPEPSKGKKEETKAA